MTHSTIQRWLRAGLALLLCASMAAHAQTRAWLDREQITDSDTVTLNIESDAGGGAPDYGPLRSDFDLSSQTSSRQVQWSNGAMTSRALYAVALSPKRTGTLQIPALQVGGSRTQPLTLQVGASSASAPAAANGTAAAFLETEVDDPTPYVQQSVGVVVRLFYAAQLLSGELVLDTPPGASLQRVGEDRTLVREVNGRRYNVVERRFLLIPERSGALVLPAAQFNGRSAGGFFNDMFGGDGRLRAASAERTLQVQAQPASAPQPWLPLHGLRLRYTAAPTTGRAGEAATIVVEAVAEGATKAQFPELPVPDVGPGAQVFAEPPQFDETFNGSTPQLKATRRFAIVPRQPGSLTVPGLRMAWWDVAAGQPRNASLPDLQLDIAAGVGGNAAPPLPVDTTSALPGEPAAASTDLQLAPAQGAPRPWGWIALSAGLAVLWLLTLVWGWRRRGRPVPARSAPGVVPAASTATAYTRADLRRAMDAGGIDEIIAVLAGMGGVQTLEQVLERLDDAQQRGALVQMQQVRWGGQGGDVGQARQELRRAFHDGPHWRAPAATQNNGLAPLYPSAHS
ncbi:BatD family protein [Stenotrophomonas sp.]|uniref:BatD family protein n=1 Tax=Stenotrophomonas sp. TaxID=69392 RepID=UPI0025CC2085|nr:BatD family protein [Stenotrophomonas sp.]MBW8374431.1 BatD family protein [Stenotrophomonas sp.]